MSRRAISLSLICLLASVMGTTGGAASAATQQASDPWWRHAVFYEIYPRSFADAKNKGMGNLAGITAKLDYLKSIGVGALWITPCFPSPQVDFGYDISDYKAIAPEYGTMADFDTLMAEAKKRDIKVCLDLVMNHTSDKHAWFVESRSSRTNPKRDWYIWRDGKPGGLPPNNWQALFGHSAWKFDPKTKQYYYHYFYPQQPDLNWRNPAVKTAMFEGAAFWLKKGVAGFRLDAVNTLFESPGLEDNPVVAGKTNRFGDPETIQKFNYLRPELHNVIVDLRHELDTFPGDRVLIGETTDVHNIQEQARWYGKNGDELQLPMNFMFYGVNKLSAPEFRRLIGESDAMPGGGQPVYLFSNHDTTRAYNRYGDGVHNDQIAKILATMLYTLRGTPILYYGEEIGMENNDPKRVEDVKDPIGKLGWPKEKGRDGERTPMQWTAGLNAGFSTVKPWLPVAPNYKTHNVETESKDPNSVLSFYRALAALRKNEPALRDGTYTATGVDDPNVLSYVRTAPDGNRIYVAMNMSANPQPIQFDSKVGKVLLSSGTLKPGSQLDLSNAKLSGFEVLVISTGHP
jgi:alpha-glucosidase